MSVAVGALMDQSTTRQVKISRAGLSVRPSLGDLSSSCSPLREMSLVLAREKTSLPLKCEVLAQSLCASFHRLLSVAPASRSR